MCNVLQGDITNSKDKVALKYSVNLNNNSARCFNIHSKRLFGVCQLSHHFMYTTCMVLVLMKPYVHLMLQSCTCT